MLMGIALLFGVAGSIQSGTLNAYHRVAALAKVAASGAVMTAGMAIVCVLIWRISGVVPAVIAGSAVGFVISTYFLRREVEPIQVTPSRRGTLKAAWSLLHFGGPYTASMLIGTGVQLAMPIVVMHLLSTESVGYYKAAASISVGYLGFLITAMAQDYYPRVSAAKDHPGVLAELINEQHRLVMIVAVPMILGTLALVPYLVPIVYSRKFTPTVEILEWQLIGDLFKFSSWTMSYAILARCRSSVYFLTEAIGGVVGLITLWLAVRWFGLPGLGISFLLTYVIYYFVVWVVVRRDVPLIWTGTNKRMMLAAVGVALLVRVLPSTRFANLRTLVALAFALAAGAYSLHAVWWELWGRKEMRTVS
jgi:PST family polysaccharide transporter